MNIRINNISEDFEFFGMTVSQLLKIKNFTFKLIVVRMNYNDTKV